MARPESAQDLAERIGSYLSSVEERAREAQIHAAEAKVRARSTLQLSAAAVVVLLLGGGAYLWLHNQATERRERATQHVASAMNEANALLGQARAAGLEDPGLWDRTVSAAEQAPRFCRVRGRGRGAAVPGHEPPVDDAGGGGNAQTSAVRRRERDETMRRRLHGGAGRRRRRPAAKLVACSRARTHGPGVRRGVPKLSRRRGPGRASCQQRSRAARERRHRDRARGGTGPLGDAAPEDRGRKPRMPTGRATRICTRSRGAWTPMTTGAPGCGMVVAATRVRQATPGTAGRDGRMARSTCNQRHPARSGARRCRREQSALWRCTAKARSGIPPNFALGVPAGESPGEPEGVAPRAEEYYLVARALRPSWRRIRNSIGWTKLHRKDLAGALAVFERAGCRGTELRQRMGGASAGSDNHQRHYEAAVDACLRATRIDPDYANAYNVMGAALQRTAQVRRRDRELHTRHPTEPRGRHPHSQQSRRRAHEAGQARRRDRELQNAPSNWTLGTPSPTSTWAMCS